MSNGQSSPVFERYGHDFSDVETITFDPDVSIRAINSLSSRYIIFNLQFYDGIDSLIEEYDPWSLSSNYEDPNSRHMLADNEELIGVYGTKDDD